jgi:hypothetical protein
MPTSAADERERAADDVAVIDAIRRQDFGDPCDLGSPGTHVLSRAGEWSAAR